MIGSDIIKLKAKQNNPDNIETLKRFTFVRKIEYANDDTFFTLSVDNAKYNIPIILEQIDTESVEYKTATLNDVFLHFTGQNIK